MRVTIETLTLRSPLLGWLAPYISGGLLVMMMYRLMPVKDLLTLYLGPGRGLVMTRLVLLLWASIVRSTFLLCQSDWNGTRSSAPPCEVALHKVGHPLCLAGLLGRVLIVRSASRGCLEGTWSSALYRKVARQGLGHPLYLMSLLDGDLVVRSVSRGWSAGTWSPALPHDSARRVIF
jgi:hypothetical protein